MDNHEIPTTQAVPAVEPRFVQVHRKPKSRRRPFATERRRPRRRCVMLQQSQWAFEGLRRHAYRVILVDAPLKFSSGPNRNPSTHYRTMSFAEIVAACGRAGAPRWRPPDLEGEDGPVIYPDSFAVGCGYEVRNTSELQVIAKRGRPQQLPSVQGKGVKLRGHIIAPRREHSRKPDCVRDELAELFEGPRCELFARSRHPAFEAWGDQIDQFRVGKSR